MCFKTFILLPYSNNNLVISVYIVFLKMFMEKEHYFHPKSSLFYPQNTFGRPQSTLPTTTIIQFHRFYHRNGLKRQSIWGDISSVVHKNWKLNIVDWHDLAVKELIALCATISGQYQNTEVVRFIWWYLLTTIKEIGNAVHTNGNDHTGLHTVSTQFKRARTYWQYLIIDWYHRKFLYNLVEVCRILVFRMDFIISRFHWFLLWIIWRIVKVLWLA
jgi:hypothetical protein